MHATHRRRPARRGPNHRSTLGRYLALFLGVLAGVFILGYIIGQALAAWLGV